MPFGRSCACHGLLWVRERIVNQFVRACLMSQGNKAVLTLAVFLETMKALVSGSEPLDAGAHMRQGSKLCIAAGGKTASITVSEVS